MVVQKTINNLKERPKDEKTAVATGVSVIVVLILLFGWGLWFIRNIKQGGDFDTFVGSQQEQFMPANLRAANEKLKELVKPSDDALRDLRDRAVDVPVGAGTDFGTGEDDLFQESGESY